MMKKKFHKILLNFIFLIILSNQVMSETIKPGPLSYEEIQTALIFAKPGDIIDLDEGIFQFEDGLSLNVDNVTIQGKGMDKTILSFKNQKSGAEGLMVTSNKVILRDFAIEDTIGDAIVVKGAKGISFIRIRTEWTDGPKETNGAYGLYPVQSKDVLIKECVAIGASDAGIYVGQSERIKVLDSIAKFNVAGIEIENSYYAEVIGNHAEHNTGGILVFDLPDLPQQGGHSVLISKNKVINNDTKNFAPEGNIVGKTPNGTGIMIMANENIEVRDNDIRNNATAGILIVSYQEETEDKNYNPIPNKIYIHNNFLSNNGYDVDKKRAGPISDVIPGKAPEIIWDGVTPIIEWFGLTSSDRIVLGKNFSEEGEADFANLNLMTKYLLPRFHKIDTNNQNYFGSIQSLKSVNFSEGIN
jgi:parallel beta-helix repeat protein